jgi:hypothetical protein
MHVTAPEDKAHLRRTEQHTRLVMVNRTWERFLVNNLLPVTLGNIVGGAVLVGAVYWFVYLRPAGGATSDSVPERP